MPFLKSMLKAAKTSSEIAAPIVVGALAGPAAGAAVKGAIRKLDPPKGVPAPMVAPSSAGDVGEARTQDRSRMKRVYGL